MSIRSASPPSWDAEAVADLGLGHVRLDAAHSGIAPGASGGRYGDPAGLPPLRAAVAQWRGIDPDEVAITTGGSLGLVATLCTLSRPASVLIPKPHYSAYSRVLPLLGLETVTYELESTRGWQVSVESVIESIRGDTRALILNQPQNPTGAISDELTLRRLAEVARAAGLMIISDETYAGIVYDGASVPDPRAIFPHADLVQVLSFSKLFGMPGERIGCVMAASDRLATIADAHWTLAMSPPASAQTMALEALRSDPDRHVERLVAALADNRGRAIEILSECERLTFVAPAGGCFVWAQIKDCPVDSRTFARNCQERARVAVVPGWTCGMESPVYVRISFAVPTDELTEGLRRLTQFAVMA
jgi:aspartate/methionine/tyrosine aminotransferase